MPSPKYIFGDSVLAHRHPREKYSTSAFVMTLEKGRILGENFSVITGDDRLLLEASRSWIHANLDHKIFFEPKLPKVTKMPGSALVLGQFFYECSGNYYHFLIDTLPRLELLRRSGLNLQDFDHILMHPPKTAFEREGLERFGIDPQKIRALGAQEHLEFDQLTVTSNFWRFGPWVTDFLKQEFLTGRPTQRPYRRLYVTRQGASTRRVVNEAAFVNLLSAYGFETLDPADYTLQEQALLFSEAEVVVGPHGAGLSNIAFCQPGTRVLEIRPSDQVHMHWDVFWRLSNLGNLPFSLYISPSVNRQKDMVVDLDDFRQALETVMASLDSTQSVVRLRKATPQVLAA